MTTIQPQDGYCPVYWVDTDASEDEDYLPQFPRKSTEQDDFPLVASLSYQSSFNSSQSSESDDSTIFEREEERKRGRINSISWDTNLARRKKKPVVHDAPLDKVRKVIDDVVDNGLERVDLSHIGLECIPDEIGELTYLTVLHNDIVKAASLQLFLYNNSLQTLNPVLFQLKNLTVLSLRFNRLESISPDIALLDNLIELSLGNNQLRYIPAELLRLKKLVTLSLMPNPFLSTYLKRVSMTSLAELAKRTILNHCPDLLKTHAQSIPQDIIESFRSVSPVNACEHCHTLFHTPTIEILVWKTVFSNPHVPLLYRFCSLSCSIQL
ncbi:hypothetical protein EDC96DRAFT_512542, partial [Choanephora cucurbitarum]